jgi:hypothetical protein
MGQRDVEAVQAAGILRPAEPLLEARHVARPDHVQQHGADEGERHQQAARARESLAEARQPAAEDIAGCAQIFRQGCDRIAPDVGAQDRWAGGKQRLGEEIAAAVADTGLQLLGLEQRGARDLQSLVGIDERLGPRLALTGDLGAFGRRIRIGLGAELVEPQLGLLDARRLLVEDQAQLVERRLQARALPLQFGVGGGGGRKARFDLRQFEPDTVEPRPRRG